MDFMDWNLCKKKFIRDVERDNERIEALLMQSRRRMDVIRGIEPKKESISFIVEGYYEAVKEILIAFMLKGGMRSSNHQCLISYFYGKHPEMEYEANLILRMSYFRNRLNYYGENVPEAFYRKNKDDFERIIEKLAKLTDI